MKKPGVHIAPRRYRRAISGEDADGKKTGKVLRVYPKTGGCWWKASILEEAPAQVAGQPQRRIVTREAPMAASKLVVVTRGGKKTGKE